MSYLVTVLWFLAALISGLSGFWWGRAYELHRVTRLMERRSRLR